MSWDFICRHSALGGKRRNLPTRIAGSPHPRAAWPEAAEVSQNSPHWMKGEVRGAWLGSSRPRGRCGRWLAPASRWRAGQEKQRAQGRIGQTHRLGRQSQLKFFIEGLVALRLALFGLALLDQMTEAAGMFPVKGHGECLHERGSPRVVGDHFEPGQRLERRPRHSHGQHEHGRQNPPLCESDHNARASITAGLQRSIGVRRILASEKIVSGRP